MLSASSLHPTIEVVDSRYQDFRSLDRLQVLADNFSNGALVYGAAALELAGDGSGAPADRRDRRRQRNSPNAPGCAPATRSRCWSSWSILSRTGAAACTAGTFVTTGTHTGLVFTEPGAHIRADYGPLGIVEVSFPR